MTMSTHENQQSAPPSKVNPHLIALAKILARQAATRNYETLHTTSPERLQADHGHEEMES